MRKNLRPITTTPRRGEPITWIFWDVVRGFAAGRDQDSIAQSHTFNQFGTKTFDFLGRAGGDAHWTGPSSRIELLKYEGVWDQKLLLFGEGRLICRKII